MSVIFITGGATGLGKEVAKQTCKDHTVTVLGLDNDDLKKTGEELGCEVIAGDVMDHEAVAKAMADVVKRHGQIDVLVNSAGLWIEGPIDENEADYVHKVMEVNAIGSMLCTRAVLPHMRQRSKGLIVNIISKNGLEVGANRSVYNASKWAMTGFTKCLQEDLKGSGIRVTGFYPGRIDTPLYESAGAQSKPATSMTAQDCAAQVVHIINAPENVIIREFGMVANV